MIKFLSVKLAVYCIDADVSINMISETNPGYDMQCKASAKIIFTKRLNLASHKMEQSGNGLTSSFMDDDISEDSNREDEAETENGIGDGQQVSRHIRRLEAFNNNDSADKLLALEVASADTGSMNDGAAKKNDCRGRKTTGECVVEDTDFVDMALSRDGGDVVNMSFDQNDARTEEQRNAKHSRNKAKYKFKEKNRPKLSPTVTFGWFDMLIGMVGITVFFVDIGTDIELAVHYFENSLWMFGGVTTGLIAGPSLVTCFLGLHWYIIDYSKEKQLLEKLEKKGEKDKAHQTPSYVWFLRFFFTLLQCGPVIR